MKNKKTTLFIGFFTLVFMFSFFYIDYAGAAVETVTTCKGLGGVCYNIYYGKCYGGQTYSVSSGYNEDCSSAQACCVGGTEPPACKAANQACSTSWECCAGLLCNEVGGTLSCQSTSVDCSMYPNTHYDAIESTCVCNQGYYDTKCYANPQNPSCTLLSACSGQWKSACASTESKITSVCPGTGEEWMCCGTATTSAIPPSDETGVRPPDDTTTSGVKSSGTGIEIPINIGLPDPQGGIAQIVRNLLTWLLGIVGMIAIIGFVISGVQYLTSAGSEDRMESAKRNMLYAIIGVVVVLSSFVIIKAIQYALEAKPF